MPDWNDAMIICPTCGDDSWEKSSRVVQRLTADGVERVKLRVTLACGCKLLVTEVQPA